MYEDPAMGVTSLTSRAEYQTATTNDNTQTIKVVTKLAKQMTDLTRGVEGANAVGGKRPCNGKDSGRAKKHSKKAAVHNTNKTTTDEAKDNDSIVKQKQEEAWKLILPNHSQRQTLADHYIDLRRPSLSERQGWGALSPEAKNTSDTYHRFLQRRALNKVKKTVTHWREIICPNPCCKDRFCKEHCCADKKNKKLANEDWEAKWEHLDTSLHSLGPDTTQWTCGINCAHKDIVDQAMEEIGQEAGLRADEKAMAATWNESLDWVKEQINEKLEAAGSSFEEIQRAEDNLRRAEKEEMARRKEQESLEVKQGSAIIDSEDEDSDEDEFPHIYSSIPTPSQTPIEVPNAVYHNPDRSKALLQSIKESITSPLTPIAESEEPTSPISDFFDQDIEFLLPGQPFAITDAALIEGKDDLKLIKALINDLGERLIHYQNHTDQHLHYAIRAADPMQERLSGTHHCSWKKHPMTDGVNNLLTPSDRPVPDLRVTDPEGNAYFLEEVVPIMADDFAERVADRDFWQKEIWDWLQESHEEDLDALIDHLNQWEEEFRPKDKTMVMQERPAQLRHANQVQDEVDFEYDNQTTDEIEFGDPNKYETPASDDNDDFNSDASDETVVHIENYKATDLETARKLVSSNDALLKSLLIETKLEFRFYVLTQEAAKSAREAEVTKTELDAAIAYKFDQTLLSLKKKFWFEGLISKDWKRYEGRKGEGKGYSVEMKGPLVETWKTFVREEERRRAVMAAASRCFL
ncbi:hypothetical protein V8E51_014284 [Hyaloscypha variabilis]